jgi:hypothetical protein
MRNNCNVTAVIPGNHDGHDTEDLVRDVHGTFWTIEEYGPSISKIDPTGRVLERFVPKGRESISGDHFTVVGNLPEILDRRPRNRGFEGLALTPNNKTLMAVVQSPLTNPTTGVGNPSRVIRLIAFDIDTETPVGEYVYVMQPVNEFSNTNPTEMKISAISALDEHRFLVLERTDAAAKIFIVDVRHATNILGSKWDLFTTSAYFSGDTNVFSDMQLIEQLCHSEPAFLPIGRSLHDGPARGGAGLPAAQAEAGDSDALWNVPAAGGPSGAARGSEPGPDADEGPGARSWQAGELVIACTS